MEEFDGLSFELKNPLTMAAVMQVETTFPPLLTERGWQLAFANRGGAAFRLEPGESREIMMHLVKGRDFTAGDVEEADDRTIRVTSRANGIIIGGMSYELDPKIKHPRRPGHKRTLEPTEPGSDDGRNDSDRVDDLTEALMHYLRLSNRRVREVEVRKVIVEIELQDCD